MRRRLVAATTLVAVLAPMAPAHATNGYWSSWRRWPWRNGTSNALTQIGGHTYASSSAREAIDAALRYETVTATLPGVIHDAGNGGEAGTFVMVLGDDGTFYTYEHLSQARWPIGTRVLLGDPIAVSGNSGHSTGPHLHFQRHDGASFASRALTLFPISGHQSAQTSTPYLSDNAGIGRTSTQSAIEGIRAAHDTGGGYLEVGVPVGFLSSWMPCRSAGVVPTRWAYACEQGWTQTYQLRDEWRAVMSLAGASLGYVVPQRFLAVYTEPFKGRDWVFHIGYPTEPVVDVSARVQTQRYERGRITVDIHNCRTTVSSGFGNTRYEDWC